MNLGRGLRPRLRSDPCRRAPSAAAHPTVAPGQHVDHRAHPMRRQIEKTLGGYGWCLEPGGCVLSAACEHPSHHRLHSKRRPRLPGRQHPTGSQVPVDHQVPMGFLRRRRRWDSSRRRSRPVGRQHRVGRSQPTLDLGSVSTAPGRLHSAPWPRLRPGSGSFAGTPGTEPSSPRTEFVLTADPVPAALPARHAPSQPTPRNARAPVGRRNRASPRLASRCAPPDAGLLPRPFLCPAGGSCRGWVGLAARPGSTRVPRPIGRRVESPPRRRVPPVRLAVLRCRKAGSSDRPPVRL